MSTKILPFLAIASTLLSGVQSFHHARVGPLMKYAGRRRPATRSTSGDSLVEVRTVSESEGKQMLEWPSIEKSSSFDERYDGGELFYVLEGAATISVSTFLNGN